jgi:hypothetical protein
MPQLQNRFTMASVGKRFTLLKGAFINTTNANGSQAPFNPGAEILNAARTLKREDSGKTLYLNLAGGFATTLPLPELGLRVKAIVQTAPTTAYTIVTANSANIMKGHVLSSDLNAASDGDLETSGGDTFSFVASKAVAGDWVEFESDGTSWFASARVSVFDAATITTAT